jgi:uncharacterized membrane protein
MAIGSNKTTGVAGAGLTIIGVISTITTIIQYASGATNNLSTTGITGVVGLLTFIGFILFMVAMHGFSKDYAEPKIFSNALNGFIFAFIGIIVAAILWLPILLSSIAQKTSATTGFTGPALGSFVIVLAIIMLINFLLYNKAFKSLAQKSGVQQFYLTGKILILAGIVNIITACVFTVAGSTNVTTASFYAVSLTPGAFIQYIAWYYAAKGYSAIQVPTTPTVPIQSYAGPFTPTDLRYCANCGNQTQPNDAYCAKCGKNLQQAPQN